MPASTRRVASIRVTRFVLVLLAVVLAGCARAVSVGNTPGPVYAISVTNSGTTELIVSYDDGAGAKALGAVRSGATERFVIAAPARTTVQVFGRAGGQSTQPVSVQLVAGQTIPVTLR